MKMKTLATSSPLLLCLVAGAARADLEPFSFGAHETLEHQSNTFHSTTDHKADWRSSTELDANVDQAIGRERLLGSASVNADKYFNTKHRDSIGYSGKGELDWSTIGDISGAFGVDTRRHQYLYGLEGDQGETSTRNLQTDNHAFARAQLGGTGRLSIFAGADASQRKFSDPIFAENEVKQWSGSGGASFATSPDLQFGLQGRYIHGTYPNVQLVPGNVEGFSIRSGGVNTRWTASGNTSFDAAVGYTTQKTEGQNAQHYVNGNLHWHWKPPSHFEFTLGVLRDASDSSGLEATIVNSNNSVVARSLNTIAHLDVTYELTAKVSLDVLAQYIHRKYDNALVPSDLTFGGSTLLVPASGSSDTARFTLSARWAPTRSTTVACGVSRETHTASESLHKFSVPYNDNTVLCSAGIKFD